MFQTTNQIRLYRFQMICLDTISSSEMAMKFHKIGPLQDRYPLPPTLSEGPNCMTLAVKSLPNLSMKQTPGPSPYIDGVSSSKVGGSLYIIAKSPTIN